MIDLLESDQTEHYEVQAKISKAAATAFAERLILRQDNDALRVHIRKKQEKASRKRKRVPIVQEHTVKEV